VALGFSSSRGSREVVSLTTDDPLLLITDALSNALRGGGIDIDAEIADMPDIEEAADRKPLKWMSFSSELETGRLSGKRAFTMVIKSEGPITR
jgi:hypothetical protein